MTPDPYPHLTDPAWLAKNRRLTDEELRQVDQNLAPLPVVAIPRWAIFYGLALAGLCLVAAMRGME